MRKTFRCKKSRVTIIYDVSPPNDPVLVFDAWPRVHFTLHPDELTAALRVFGIATHCTLSPCPRCGSTMWRWLNQGDPVRGEKRCSECPDGATGKPDA